MNRRLVIIIGAILGILLIVGLYFFLALSPQNGGEGDGGLFGDLTSGDRQPGEPGDGGFSINDDPFFGGSGERAKLVRISDGPATGSVVFTTLATTTASSTRIVRYLERDTGHIFEYDVSKGRSERISNTTVPGVRTAYWFGESPRVILEYIDDDGSLARYNATIENGSLAGSFLSRSVADLSTFSSTTRVETAVAAAGATGSVVSPDGRPLREAFSTPLRLIEVEASGTSTVAYWNKPTGFSPGVAFVRKGAGPVERIAGGINGLAVKVHASGDYALVTGSGGESPALWVWTRSRGVLAKLSFGTVAGKCAWAVTSARAFCGIPREPAEGMYPDDWYKGKKTFTDDLWVIDVLGSEVRLVEKFSGEEMDISEPALSPDGSYLSFVNRKDGSLWGYDLSLLK